MFEFNGKANENVVKYLRKKELKILMFSLAFAFAILTPIIVFVTVKYNLFRVLIAYFSSWAIILFVAVPLQIHSAKKSTLDYLPNRIYSEDEYIVFVANKYEEYRNKEDIKEVLDFGEFYDLKFVYGKGYLYFICQKDLLSKGTLEDFEAFFDGEIVRK